MNRLRTQMRWIMGIIALAFLLSTFLMYDSGSRRGGRRSSSGDGMEDYAVADINGRRLMRSDLERRVGEYLEESGRRDLTSDDVSLAYQAALDQFATELQLTKEVKDSGISISDAEVDQAVKDYADLYFPTREAFYQSLENSGIKLADYKKSVAQQLANQQLIQSSLGDLTVSEDEAVKFYDDTKNLFFRQPGGFKISLADFATRDAAEKVRSLLLEGASWDVATSGDVVASPDVKSVSTEPMFVPDSMFEGRLEAMKDLPVGEVSPVFEMTSDDFAVGVKNEKVDEKISPYEEVSADVRVFLQRQKESDAMNRFSQSLLSKAKIVIHDASLFPSKTPEILPISSASPDVVSSDAPASVDTTVTSGE